MASERTPDPYDLDPDRAPLLRSTVLAWQASTCLLVVAGVLAIGWLWVMTRLQQHLGASGALRFSGGDVGGGSPSLVERIDAATGTISLLSSAALVAALGIGLRMAGDVVASRLRAQQAEAPDPTIGPDTP